MLDKTAYQYEWHQNDMTSHNDMTSLIEKNCQEKRKIIINFKC